MKGCDLPGSHRWRPKVNVIHFPGLYMGRCHDCGLYIEAEKRMPCCDDCWQIRIDKVEQRKTADENEDVGC